MDVRKFHDHLKSSLGIVFHQIHPMFIFQDAVFVQILQVHMIWHSWWPKFTRLRSHHPPDTTLPIGPPLPKIIFAFIGKPLGPPLLGYVIRIGIVFTFGIVHSVISKIWRLERRKRLIPERNSQGYNFFDNDVEGFMRHRMQVVDV